MQEYQIGDYVCLGDTTLVFPIGKDDVGVVVSATTSIDPRVEKYNVEFQVGDEKLLIHNLYSYQIRSAFINAVLEVELPEDPTVINEFHMWLKNV